MASVYPEGATLTFHCINYEVKIRKGCCGCGKTKRKLILKGVNGCLKPGMNAIMGPTGGGKSSLLDVLAGRKDPDGLSGLVLVDGQRQPANFNWISGYVTQDDIILGSLTVRENINYSAALRLPRSVSAADRKIRVDNILHELELTGCADTKVGNDLIRGVSGGERKRTNIGMELITSPQILFLDEPTTGLDANTAHSVMALLQRLSRRGQTIIFSIHQPRYSIYQLFDTLVLLARGEVVYHGPCKNTLQYFDELGYECQPFNNPADHFLDILSGGMENMDPLPLDEANMARYESSGSFNDTGEEYLVYDTYTSRRLLNVQDVEAANPRETLPMKLAHRYRESNYYSRTIEELASILTESGHTRNAPIQKIEHPTPFYYQLWTLSKRAFLCIRRHPFPTLLQICVMFGISVVVGLLYLQLNTDASYANIQNRAGAFFFIVMNMIFGNLSSVEPFIRQRALFKHEVSNGFYRTSSYFLAKVFCDIIPNRMLPIVMYACISYWMIGLDPQTGKFFRYMLNLILTSFAGTSVCFAVSSGAEAFAVANLFITVIYIAMMIFGGLLLNLLSLPVWCRWIKYLSIFRYSMDALQINELQDRVFCDPPPNAKHCVYGNAYLNDQGIAHSSEWDYWRTQVGIFGLMVGFMLIAYIQLRRIKRYT